MIKSASLEAITQLDKMLKNNGLLLDVKCTSLSKNQPASISYLGGMSHPNFVSGEKDRAIKIFKQDMERETIIRGFSLFKGNYPYTKNIILIKAFETDDFNLLVEEIKNALSVMELESI